MGSHNSVASRFRNDCPNITILKCICHTAHLCANYACKTLPRECEDLGRNIYNFFKLSSKRQHQFKEFHILLDAEVHKMLYSTQTRWLSLKAVVDRILEQWEPLQMYFTQLWEEQHLPAAEIIYSSITHPFSEKVIIPLLYNQAAALFKDILICYMDNSYVLSTNVKDIDPDNELHFLPINEIYLGLKVYTELQKPEIIQQAEHVQNFHLECFIPHKSIDPQFHVTVPTLTSIFEMFPRNLDSSCFTRQSVDDEWRLLPFAQLPLDTTNEKLIDVFWVKLLNYDDIMDLQKYTNLSQFVLNLLCLPHSNAECERLFSKVNLTKTKNRNKMKTTTLKNNLTAWECVKNSGTCKLFEPSADMIDHCNQSMYNFNTSNTDNENEGVSDEDSEYFMLM
ncbi:SCAN domain-containing protein 3-like [Prorops nasuta]|uniref:SCAN domain-containing protein 3-like n=1 Tax=Prorops nasuta TaxID=863751 RepID=UPI0034CFFBD2